MAALAPIDLRCEHLSDPQGLNTAHPRLGWALSGGGEGARQSAYRIVVGRDAAEVARGLGDMWDTGRVTTADCLLIPYSGAPLNSDAVLHWSVQVWDEDGKASGFAPPARIRTGLMRPEDWRAKWVSRALVPPGGRLPPQNTVYDNPYGARPADYYRRIVALDRKPVRATVYATALGLYEVWMNGVRLGDQVLAPGWTDYHTRVEYQSYDATEHLREGDNVFAAIVGEGWYSGRVALDPKRAGSHYGGRPAFLCQMHIEYDDGSVDIVATDESWKTDHGAIVYSDLLLGEKYDARLEKDWHSPDYDANGAWNAEVVAPRPRAPKVEAPRGVPIRKTEQIAPRFLHRDSGGRLIYDLGQNLSGHVRAEFDLPEGATLTLRHGEALKEDGALYTENLRMALATDIYVSSGGRQVFEPRFTFHGFRYVEVSLPEGMGPDDITLTAHAVHSDMPSTGVFECGSELLNKLQSNIVWTQRSNFLSVPTDCPQRDERMGWLGDAQVFFHTSAFNMDVSGFFTKWLMDVADAQTPEGAFTDVAPSLTYTRFLPDPPRGAPGWGDAGVLIPWRMYQHYGDLEILTQHYDGMVRWLDLIERNNPDGIRTEACFSNWGDWLALGPMTPKAVMATAYWALMASNMAEVARLLNRRQDAARFSAMYRDVRSAFRSAFLAPDGRIEGDTQAGYVFALAFDLLEADERPAGVAHLKRTIDAANGHILCGIHAIRLVCPVLADAGETDLVYKLLLREEYPSWGFSIRNGATTIWERWDGWTPENGFQDVAMNSLNHYALGAIGEFLYQRIAGIGFTAAGAATREIALRPLPSEVLGWCRASLRSHLGEIRSEWRTADGGFDWQVTVPPNCVGRIEMPPGYRLAHGDEVHGETHAIAAGAYRFRIEREQTEQETVTA